MQPNRRRLESKLESAQRTVNMTKLEMKEAIEAKDNIYAALREEYINVLQGGHRGDEDYDDDEEVGEEEGQYPPQKLQRETTNQSGNEREEGTYKRKETYKPAARATSTSTSIGTSRGLNGLRKQQIHKGSNNRFLGGSKNGSRMMRGNNTGKVRR